MIRNAFLMFYLHPIATEQVFKVMITSLNTCITAEIFLHSSWAARQVKSLSRRRSERRVGALLILQPFRHSPMSQLILQLFCCFTYTTVHSPTLPLLHLHHSSFSNPSFASPTSQALHLASRSWHSFKHPWCLLYKEIGSLDSSKQSLWLLNYVFLILVPYLKIHSLQSSAIYIILYNWVLGADLVASGICISKIGSLFQNTQFIVLYQISWHLIHTFPTLVPYLKIR